MALSVDCKRFLNYNVCFLDCLILSYILYEIGIDRYCEMYLAVEFWCLQKSMYYNWHLSAAEILLIV